MKKAYTYTSYTFILQGNTMLINMITSKYKGRNPALILLLKEYK